MNWAFVDYENVGSLESLKAADYARILVFSGPGNSRIRVGTPPEDGFCSIELIRVGTKGRNNLDFHLAFHLGRFHEQADSSVCFHVVSNDTGFDGLVDHLNRLGRSCRKVRLDRHPAPPLSEEAARILDGLRRVDASKRPRRRESLLNWVRSRVNGVAPESVFDTLVNAGIVEVSGPKISYAFKPE